MKEYQKLDKKVTTLNIQAGKINEIRDVELQESSTRVFRNGKIYSSNYLGEITPDELEKDALANPDGAIEYDYELEKNISFKGKVGENLSSKELFSLSQGLIDYIKSSLPDFVLSGKMSHERYQNNLETSEDTKINVSESKTNGFIVLKRKGSPNIMDSAFGFQTGQKELSLNDMDLFLELHKKWDNEVSIENGKYPVLFTDSTPPFFSKFLQSLSPESYHSGSVFFANELGKQIAHKDISFTDVRVNKDFAILNEYDDEAVKLKPEHFLIRDGVFESIIYDKKMAQKYNTESTGNGRRSYNGPITPGTFETSFKPGTKTIKEMSQEHEKFIISVICGGGDTTSSGDFSSPVQLAFLVEKGEVIGRLGQITINNNIKNVLNEDFVAISKDHFYISHSYAFCGRFNVMS